MIEKKNEHETGNEINTDLNKSNETKESSSVWTKKAMERAAANASVKI